MITCRHIKTIPNYWFRSYKSIQTTPKLATVINFDKILYSQRRYILNRQFATSTDKICDENLKADNNPAVESTINLEQNHINTHSNTVQQLVTEDTKKRLSRDREVLLYKRIRKLLKDYTI